MYAIAIVHFGKPVAVHLNRVAPVDVKLEEDSSRMISGALEGTVCIDVSGHVAGPYAGSLLGDLGCDVLKVELPGGGELAVDH